jgi:hypothetical protein
MATTTEEILTAQALSLGREKAHLTHLTVTLISMALSPGDYRAVGMIAALGKAAGVQMEDVEELLRAACDDVDAGRDR